jgi:hypothetical protein
VEPAPQPGYTTRMDENKFPYPDDEQETISPDVAGAKEKPLRPGEAVAREEDIYGDTTADENREDQRDMHGGTADDIV